MRRAYDYGFHADNSRPRNTGVVSDRLADHLIDSLCVWGDEARWRETLDGLEQDGWTGVMFILGQADQAQAITGIGERLRAIGDCRPRLPPRRPRLGGRSSAAPAQ